MLIAMICYQGDVVIMDGAVVQQKFLYVSMTFLFLSSANHFMQTCGHPCRLQDCGDGTVHRARDKQVASSTGLAGSEL